MATNKNALIRYKILDNCFRNIGKKYFIDNLIEECNKALSEIDSSSNGISRRQIFEDILFMQSSEGWSIALSKIKEGRKVYYRYEDPNFSINNMPLNSFEVHQLQVALDILSQFKGMPQFEWIHELVPKLKQGMVHDNESFSTIINFDSNKYLKGIEYLGLLYNAIYNKKVLLIKYQPFNHSQPYNLKIHPYYLKQYNNRWFLYGYSPEKEKFDWNMALDRIVDISEILDNYQDNLNIDWLEYFEDILGVTKHIDAKVENITLHFYGKTGNYIISKPIHGSQKSKWISNEILEVKLQLIINYELEHFILSYVDTVLVVEPKELRFAIQKRIENARIINE
ncbi:YafY family protein [[Flexibacter] sp. ATCC 35103]|uniref:helix-turn-helix transcriptional regulator n=1 Tax=[Flexibacter] sp. ATCC 35103 TaxID=1937528 RepID=UPI0009CFAE9E|nr:WYL domain-containing protein [[Flexibacter] sp. ATCC 35103]OMQ13679.1 WYL domain-containing protein [[Flexibacter] sp. ATCC 35103]